MFSTYASSFYEALTSPFFLLEGAVIVGAIITAGFYLKKALPPERPSPPALSPSERSAPEPTVATIPAID